MNRRQHLIQRYKVLRKRSRKADDGTAKGVAKSVRLGELAQEEYWRIMEKTYMRFYRAWLAGGCLTDFRGAVGYYDA